ncbi:MAG: hypothetical protein CW338_10025 [Clostridiales bacterium]|nr:hypothetical protein [Clostridiales bacterium]
MDDKRSIQNTRAEMEIAKQQSEKKFSGGKRQPRRYKVYDKIKDHVSLRTVDIVIIVTAVLIIGLLIYGIITGNPQQ